MGAQLVALTLILLATALPARAEVVVASLSDKRVEIESNFIGTNLLLFGLIERDARTVGRTAGYDVVVIVRGPDEALVTRRKERIAGIWVNRESATFPDVPSYYAVLTARPLEEITRRAVLARHRLGLDHLRLEIEQEDPPVDEKVFREAFVRRKMARGLYIERPGAVEMMTRGLFSTRIPLPANIRVGGYRAHVFVFADGALVATHRLGFWVAKSGFEERVSNLATRHPFFYGIVAVAVAVFAGWLAGVLFRRD